MDPAPHPAPTAKAAPTAEPPRRPLAGRLLRVARRRWRLLLTVAAVPVLVAGGVFVWAYKTTPLPRGLQEIAPGSYVIADREDRPLRELLAENETYAGPLRLEDAPPALVHATLSAEDKRFFTHYGVDFAAMARALGQAVSRREVHSGGSTITMQLLKTADPRPRTIQTKLREALLSLKLERRWSKERILREYLSRIHYGNMRRGCVSAARYYFGKRVVDLSAAEAAFLAGLPWAPTRLNPHTNMEGALERQRWVLGRMRENGYLDQAAYERALAEKLVLRDQGNTFAAPHFVDLLLRQPEVLAALEQPSGPPRLRTTLDSGLQEFAESQLRLRLAPLRQRNVKNGAVVVLRNSTGEVLALVGSVDYFAGRHGQVNGAWAPRSPGSALKPFTYLLAMLKGATPASIAADIPTEYVTETGTYIPQNYDRRFHGPMRYRQALANSLNIAAVRVLREGGGAENLRAGLEHWGISNLEEDTARYGLGLTIGNAEVRLLELTSAYATLARLGYHQPVRFLARTEDPPLRRGHDQMTYPDPLPGFGDHVPPGELSANCWLVADMLSDNFARTLTFGPRSWLYFDFPVAAKTGTSSDYRDNWAFGYTPEFTVGVWVGNFDGTPMHEVSGVAGAAPVLHDVMTELHERFGTSWYEQPRTVRQAEIHPVTGKIIDPALDAFRPRPETVKEYFHHPGEQETREDYDAEGRILLPREYARWLASGDNWLGNLATAEGSPQVGSASRAPKILTPQPGAHYYLDPDLPDQGALLTLESDLPTTAALQWTSPTLEMRPDARRPGQTNARLSPGRHEITLTDPATGRSTTTWLLVEQL